MSEGASAEPGPGPSVAVAFAKALAMMLVCGIVGPIFLVVYFSIDEPGTGWMLWWGVVITVLDVVVAGAIAGHTVRRARRSYRLATTGRRASADVLSIGQTGVQINDQPLVKLRLRIHGGDVTPFEVDKRMVVPVTLMPLLHGGGLAVNLDPETREFDVDWNATARGRRLSSPPPSDWLPTPESATAPAVPAVPAAAPVRTAAERLAELDELMRRDLVSTEEYDASRRRILGEL